MSSIARVVGTVVLALLALAGLLMSACGGIFTIAGFAQTEMVGALVISLPSVLVGGLLVWWAGRRLRGRLRDRPEAATDDRGLGTH